MPREKVRSKTPRVAGDTSPHNLRAYEGFRKPSG